METAYTPTDEYINQNDYIGREYANGSPSMDDLANQFQGVSAYNNEALRC